MQRDVNKVYLPIGDRDMLEYSLETMDRSPRISQVALVVREDDEARAEMLIAETMPSKLSHVVVGGASRHLSEIAGLRAEPCGCPTTQPEVSFHSVRQSVV